MDNIIEVQNLTKHYDGLAAVENIDVTFPKGKVSAVVGPNGAGKTTLFDMISGYVKPTSGKILYKYEDITNLRPWEIARLGIGRSFQDIRVFNELTIVENVLVAIQGQVGERFWEPVLFHRKLLKQEIQNVQLVNQLLSSLSLMEKGNHLAKNLSQGEQKLLSIARLISMESNILFLDEPTSGVHQNMIQNISTILRSLCQKGKTIVIIEHDFQVVRNLADWIVVMDSGKIVNQGPINDLLTNKIEKAYGFGN
jgi:ABC-type branched-subunit amino acid transport system ATPase component